MADFNQILTPGDVDAGIINVVNEIPEGSCHKIEWNRKVAAFQLDRVEPAIFAKPTNYGFIPQTLDVQTKAKLLQNQLQAKHVKP